MYDLITVNDKKVSRYKHLKQVEKTLGKTPKELQGLPVLRNELSYLWEIYIEINNGSEGRITYQDIKAYCELMGDLTAFEVEAVKTLDNLKMSTQHG